MHMFKLNKTIYQILLLTCFILLFYLFSGMNRTEAIYIKSELNNKEYFVQNIMDKEEAAYILSVLDKKIEILNKHLYDNSTKYSEYTEYIDQFCSRVNNLVIYENSHTGNYTSYVVNKGEELVVCLRSKNTGELHDINLTTYVVLHEMAHIACPELHHTELFTKIFKFFVKIAININIYKYINYQMDPVEYCGMQINENLLRNS